MTPEIPKLLEPLTLPTVVCFFNKIRSQNYMVMQSTTNYLLLANVCKLEMSIYNANSNQTTTATLQQITSQYTGFFLQNTHKQTI